MPPGGFGQSPTLIAFVAGDWGTSSLRLWALAANGTVLAERRSAEGMATLVDDGKARCLEGVTSVDEVFRVAALR